MVKTDPRIIFIDGTLAIPEAARRCVAVIGNLDGVHLGHQFLIDEAKDLAEGMSALTGAVIFSPHPRSFFQPDGEPFQLTPLLHKAELALACGLDRVFIVPFNERLSSLSPEGFVKDILHKQLGLIGVVVGEEFQFGKGRAGNAASLQSLAQKHDMASLIVTPIGTGAEKYSSSSARKALREGKPETALAILGRHWSVRGKVAHGKRLGHKIGFPTINIPLGDYLAPRKGIYAVTIQWDHKTYFGVGYYGARPTVDGTGALLEAHIFDFNQTIYDETVEIFFHHFIRDDEKFSSVEKMKEQIARDSDKAKNLFNLI